jgi:predicted Zn-dependent protease
MNKFLLNETGYSNETEYYMTHPLSKNRKIFLENQVKGEKKINDNDFNKKYKDKFNFMKAKIMAFQKGRVSNLNTDYTLYGEIIINMKNGKIDKSLKDINYLIEKYKNIPYFYELRGDIYFKTNKINESLKDYDKADEILKNDMLIKKTIAFSIIKYKQKNLYNDAITKLDFIIQNSNNDNGIYKLLAEVYYAKDELSLSYLNLSKYYFNLKDKQRAKKYILMAKENTNDIKILNKIEDFEIGMDNNF